MLRANLVVAVGSVDGVLTAAAVLRNVADPDCGVVFTQAFQVDKLDSTAWGENRKIVLVDLAVNNRDPQMTATFLRRIADAGHEVIGVCDEHDAAAWQAAFAAAGLDYEGLALKPVSGKGTPINSSGALLLSVLGNETDSHTRALCEAADAGDRMDFTTRFGGMVNSAVKSAIADDTRRIHLARHLAFNAEPDAQIQGWIDEYQAILATHAEILAARIDLGGGLIKVITVGRKVDVTTLMLELYKLGARVAVLDGEVFNPAVKAKERQISFGCAPTVKVDLLAALKAAEINAGGMPAKANVAIADEVTAIVAVKAKLAEVAS